MTTILSLFILSALRLHPSSVLLQPFPGRGAAVIGGFPSLPHSLAFANLPLTFEQLGIGIVLAVVVIRMLIPAVSAVRSWFVPHRTQIVGDTLTVKKATEPVTEETCGLHRNELTRRIKALEANHQALESKIDAGFAAMDARWSNDVRELRTQIDNLHKRVTDTSSALGDKISALPEHIIDLLHTAKELNR